MSNNRFWNTLATRDIERARAFYKALGFTVENMPIAGGITVRPNDSTLICLFETQIFGSMISGQVCDTTHSQEIVQSISVETKRAADELLKRATQAGGKPIGQAKEQPFGYSCGFTDPDGHVWSVLWFAGSGGES